MRGRPLILFRRNTQAAARLMARNSLTEEQAKQRIESQLPANLSPTHTLWLWLWLLMLMLLMLMLMLLHTHTHTRAHHCVVHAASG